MQERHWKMQKILLNLHKSILMCIEKLLMAVAQISPEGDKPPFYQ